LEYMKLVSTRKVNQEDSDDSDYMDAQPELFSQDELNGLV